MNSGQSSTKLNDMLTDFVDYVYSFYGDKKAALYPLFNVDTDKQVDKTDILGAVYDYLHEKLDVMMSILLGVMATHLIERE